MPTRAQLEALDWLYAHGLADQVVHSGVLEKLYEERFRAKVKGTMQEKWPISQGRRSAWRRTSGRVLAAMSEVGLLRPTWAERWGLDYKFTDEGRRVARERSTS